jgi:hypothetical protein
VAAGQLGLTGGAQPIFFSLIHEKQLLLEAQQHKKYAQTIPLDDGVSSLFELKLLEYFLNINFDTSYFASVYELSPNNLWTVEVNCVWK